jgi:soluble calcium-activated nucleotidase 1
MRIGAPNSGGYKTSSLTASLTSALSTPSLNGNNSNGNITSSISNNSNSTPNRLKVSRSEMMAYPPGHNSCLDSCLSRLQFHVRKNTQAVLCCFAFLCVLLIITSDTIHDMGRSSRSSSGVGMMGSRGGLRGSFANVPLSTEELVHWGGAVHAGTFRPEDAMDPVSSSSSSTTGTVKRTYHFATVTDLDQKSAVKSKKPEFQAIFVPGILTCTTDSFNVKYELKFQDERTLTTKHNEAGRGAEFSELQLYNNRLLTFDDRTGDVFEIINDSADPTKSKVVPRFVITEGEGDTDKGMKWEWATVKDNLLYMGSMGKEYTRPDGSIENENNLWIGILNARGELRRENWKHQYTLVRKALGALAPGYIIMEAILWSPHLKKWVFLPRRISSEAYDENKDERNGGTRLVLVDEYFTKTEVVDIKLKEPADPLRGFSSFAFVPGTNDQHAMAIQSVEEDCTGDMDVCKQRSYFFVFDITTGEVLSPEVKYKADLKFEGLEFVNLFQSSPK